MKRKTTSLIFALTAIAIITIIACNKDEHSSPAGGTDETLNQPTLKSSDKKFESFSGTCNNPTGIEMKVKVKSDITEITTESSNANSIDAFKLFVAANVLVELNGRISIPRDGKNYWFVPFNGDAPTLIAGGSTVSVDCKCSGGTCTLSGSATAGGGSTFSCVAGTCTSCCEMVITETSGGALISVGSGVIVEAEAIEINGNVSRNYKFDSYTGVCANPGKVEMNIHTKANEIIVKREAIPNGDANAFKFISIGVQTSQNQQVLVPNDGKKYWIIPFDEKIQPFIVNGGSSIEMNCGCTGTGNCRGKTTISNGTSTSTCENDGCNACCVLTFTVGGSKIVTGGGVLVNGPVLKLNGVTYQ
ncbi:MAG: hypothetical protein M3R27_06500 [Bacteroidota bacterium]|nr:hypothetical protein [Bacteroidota bacterium]